MTYGNALKILNIEDYGERIFHSNSHGELFHLWDYMVIAKDIEHMEDKSWFREWFIDMVKQAEEKWNRPESIFQHIGKLFIELVESLENNVPKNTHKTG